MGGGRVEQCRVGVVGRGSQPGSCGFVRVAGDTCGLALSCWGSALFLFAASSLGLSGFSAGFDGCRQCASELMVWFCGIL